VRVAQLLGAAGFVMLGDTDGHVLFTAVSGDPIRPANDAYQGEQSVLTVAGLHGYARDDDAYIRYGNGRPFSGLRADAIRDGEYVYAVFTEGRAAWTTLDVGNRGAHWEPVEDHCECGATFERNGRDMCPTCKRERCPECGGCACLPPPRDRTCSRCNFVWSVAHFDGDSTVCKDCV
jgi:hypothetical protein